MASPAEIEEEAIKWHRLLMGESVAGRTDRRHARPACAEGRCRDATRAMLYIDQCEELYTRSESGESRRFSDLVAAAVRHPRLLVMLSLRSDHYGRFQDDADLFRAADTIDVTPLERAAIDRVIRLPAERLRVRFDPPQVVAHMADAAAREPGALPLLSDLLADAWRTMAMVEQTSGQPQGVLRIPFQIVDIGAPLADKAERFFALHRDRQDDLRRLFTLKLALVPKQGDIVRRRARRAECSDAEWALAEALADTDWRLVTTSEENAQPVAEVAHEALLRHWPRAARWLDESREFLIWKGQFETERHAWEQAAEADQPRALLTGLRLDAASRWQRERPEDISAAETSFIAASEQAVADRKLRDEQAALRLARQRTWIQRLSASALIVVTVVAFVATWQGHKARLAEQQQSMRAERRSPRGTNPRRAAWRWRRRTCSTTSAAKRRWRGCWPSSRSNAARPLKASACSGACCR